MIVNPEENRVMIEDLVKTLPGSTNVGSAVITATTRGALASNLLIVDPVFGDPFPHFEFRGHNDLVLSYGNTPEAINTGLMEYIKQIYNVLNMAHMSM